MRPNELHPYLPCEIQDKNGRDISIRQFAGIIPQADGSLSFSFIPWSVDLNPVLNRKRTIEIPEGELYRVSLYSRE